jgi:thioredoxin:protein disulfide reductase
LPTLSCAPIVTRSAPRRMSTSFSLEKPLRAVEGWVVVAVGATESFPLVKTRVGQVLLAASLLLLGAFPGFCQANTSPFAIRGDVYTTNGDPCVRFEFTVPPEHVLYADRLAFQLDGGAAVASALLPEPIVHRDELTGKERKGYDRSFVAEVKPGQALPVNLLIKLQGCSNSACYFPEKHRFEITQSGVREQTDEANPAALAAAGTGASGVPDTNGFRVAGRETGYLSKGAFLGFLERARTGKEAAKSAVEKFNDVGPIASLFLILIGGVGLNLTPCVLPLIPINLAILGAGARASSRRRGFALGGMYGLGMALVYGGLGLVVVLTGAKFGSLNSSPWFNLGIAVVFLVMSLAMFDKLNIDFSRFQGRTGAPGASAQKSRYALALSMGAMAALLAGACVAPVVISVLLLAAHWYGKGLFLGLMLPFLLGLGMALPWPFAGAGLSFLPKPGKWMKWVKTGFGVVILVFAAYYGHLGVRAWESRHQMAAASQPGGHSGASEAHAGQALDQALTQARASKMPVFIDFAASWCKNCTAMDATVFSADEVKARLKDFVVVRFDAESPNESPAKEVLDRFGVMGLPTYVVLLPQ